MPPVVAAVASFVVAVGASTAAVTVVGIGGLQLIGTAIGAAVVYGGLAVASAYLSSALAPDAPAGQRSGSVPRPKPADGQQTTRQPVQSRWRHYGRVKVGGVVYFYESKNGLFYVGIMVGQGQYTEIEAHWLNDAQTTIDAAGLVTSADYINGGRSRIRILPHDGRSDQLAQPFLTAGFPGVWTADHRLRGIANVLIVYEDVPAEDFSKVYRGGVPGYRAVIRYLKIYDPRTSVTQWSDNAALVILDFLTSPDGMKHDLSRMHLPAFIDAANICDEDVPLKSGQTEPRYRIWGSYRLNEQPRDVLKRLLASCDGELYTRPDGKISLRVGKWAAPTVTLDDRQGHILSYEISQGSDQLAAFNELKFTYTSPDHDYQEIEGDPWQDTANITLRGETLENSTEFLMCPSHSQARRLAKISMHRSNPRWVGRVITNLFGLQLIGERTATIVLSEMGINETFVITSMRFLDDGTGCELGIASMGSDAYAWNAAIEEGTPPAGAQITSTALVLNPPANIAVTIGQRQVTGNTLGAIFKIAWDAPARDSFSAQARYRKVGTTSYKFATSEVGTHDVETEILNDGAQYEIAVRTITSGGQFSDWSADIVRTATADTTTPGIATNLTASHAGGVSTISWTMPNSANATGAHVYHGAVFATSTLVGTVFGGAGAARDFAHSPTVAGEQYWVAVINSSGVEGDEAGPVTANI